MTSVPIHSEPDLWEKCLRTLNTEITTEAATHKSGGASTGEGITHWTWHWCTWSSVTESHSWTWIHTDTWRTQLDLRKAHSLQVEEDFTLINLEFQAGWRTCQSPGWRVTGRRRRTGSSLKEADVPCTDIQHEAPNETGHTTIKLKLRQKLYLELPNFLSTTKVNQYFQLVGVSKVFNV